MKRKFIIITISYIIGLIWGLYFNKNIALIFCLFFGFLVILKRNNFITIVIIIIAISCIYNEKVKKDYDLKYLGIKDVEVIGTVVKNPNNEKYSNQYIIKVNSIKGKENLKNTQLLINEKKDKEKNIDVKYGDLIYVTGTFEFGEQSRNYKGYNYNEYLRSKRIYGTVVTETKNIKIYKNNNINLYNKILHKFYNLIKQKIDFILPNDIASICTAIILGDKSNIEKDVINNFSESSLSHILAISGMHMTYIIMIFSLLLKSCNKKNKDFIMIFIIIFFCNLVGNSESVIRSSIMTIVYILGNVLHRKSDNLTNIAISALVILIINPYAIKSMSFLLSFGGTLGIIIFANQISEKMNSIKILNKDSITKYIKQSIVMSISANIIIIPILAVFFNKISLIFIITNILASFLLSFIMPLAFIFIGMSFFSINITIKLSVILNLFFYLLILISNIFSKVKILNFIISTPYKITIIFYYIIVILISIKTKYKIKCIIKRFLKVIIILYLSICIIMSFIKYVDTCIYIHFIDVGQGDSTLIITRQNKNILVDGGGNEHDGDYVGKDILLPYLLDRRIKKIDYIMISHFDSDHCQGILYIMQYLKVENVIISEQGEYSENYKKFIEIVNDKKINLIIVKSNMKIQIDKYAYFDILWPENTLINENIINNNSIVARFRL